MEFRSNLPAADYSYIFSDHEQREWHVSAYLLPPYEFIYGYSMEFDEEDPEFGIDQDHLNDYRPGDAEVIDGTIKVMQNGRYGFCDRYGTLIIGDGYEYTGQFGGGLCIVGNSGKYGLIDTGGNIVVPLRYESIYWNYVTPNITFQLPNSHLLDMPKLEIDVPHYTYGQPRRYLLEVENWNLYMPWRTPDKLLIYHDGFEGVMDTEGNVCAPLCYDIIQSSGIAKRGEKWSLLDEEGIEVLPAVYDSLRMITHDLSISSDGLGEFVIACKSSQYDRVHTRNGLLLCELAMPVYTAVHVVEKIVQTCGIEQLDETHFLLRAEGKYGVIQTKGTIGRERTSKQLCGFCEVLPFTWDDPEACKRAFLLRMLQAYKGLREAPPIESPNIDLPRRITETYDRIVYSQGINSEEYQGFTALKNGRWFFVEMKRV